MKTCRLCSIAKPLGEFPTDGRSGDGHRYQCTQCLHSVKRCAKCDREVPYEGYYIRKGRPYGPCRACQVAERQAFRSVESERINLARRQRRAALTERQRRDEYLRWKYGIGLPDLERMLVEQNGCDICGTWDETGKGWHVDHDHACCPPDRSSPKTCGRCVRGILCHSCNLLLGHAKDRRDVLLRAVDYLGRWCVDELDSRTA